jgi:hypothetical protein
MPIDCILKRTGFPVIEFIENFRNLQGFWQRSNELCEINLEGFLQTCINLTGFFYRLSEKGVQTLVWQNQKKESKL